MNQDSIKLLINLAHGLQRKQEAPSHKGEVPIFVASESQKTLQAKKARILLLIHVIFFLHHSFALSLSKLFTASPRVQHEQSYEQATHKNKLKVVSSLIV